MIDKKRDSSECVLHTQTQRGTTAPRYIETGVGTNRRFPADTVSHTKIGIGGGIA